MTKDTYEYWLEDRHGRRIETRTIKHDDMWFEQKSDETDPYYIDNYLCELAHALREEEVRLGWTQVLKK